MKRLILLTAVLAAPILGAQAAIYSTNWSSGWDNGTVVADGSYSGWTDTRTVNSMPAGTLQGVAVTLSLSSEWTGDLYAYLASDTGFCVLLDRVGTAPFGSGAGDLNIRLAGDGFGTHDGFAGGGDFANIHSYGGGDTVLTTWNPDNSGITSGSGSLGSFTAANGTWTLFIGDLSAGDLTTVESWGLQMDIVAVPEPSMWAGVIFGGGLGVFYLARRQFRRWRGAINQWLDAA